MPELPSVHLEGIDRVYAKLGQLDGNRVLRVPVEQACAVLQRDMKVYPSPRPEQKYVRTGTLGRRWTKRVRSGGDGVVGVVGNNTTYAPFVHARQFQAAPHRGRWQTDEEVLERNRDRIVEFFRAAIALVLRG